MRDRDLYAQVLGIREPWKVVNVELDTTKQEVSVFVETASNAAHVCMACGNVCPGYDSRERRWRHLDTCQFKTILVAKVPRVNCPEHGVQQVPVPWAEPNSRFTGLFEAMVIGWLGDFVHVVPAFLNCPTSSFFYTIGSRPESPFLIKSPKK